MRVVSVNIGLPREVSWQGTGVLTGIFKDPVQGSVRVGRLNLDGDRQADLTVHGGAEKAVYGYAAEHYDYWRRELPQETFGWGKFGENLTTEGLVEDELCIGDRLRLGSAVLVVTQPRLPCYKLALKFGREDMIKRFLRSRRSGFYFSVAEEGEVTAGSPIEIISRDSGRVSVADISRLFLSREPDRELLHRAIQVDALPLSWKEDLAIRAEARGR
jgi:MOSC domain-containing protein YiiM